MIDNHLSELLGKKLIKITQLSKETGVSRTTLTNLYYQRTHYISFDVLGKLCNYLECEVSDIFKFRKGAQTCQENQKVKN